MNKIFSIMSYFLLLILVASCDDGRLEENSHYFSSEEGKTVKLTASVSGLSSWPSTYSVAIAGYNDVSDYAVITKSLPISHENGKPLSIVMNGVGEDVKTLKLCVIDRLRKSLVDFIVLDEDQLNSVEGDTIFINSAETLNLGMYNSIQQKVFDTKCIACHGKSTFAAANLYLTAEKSYNALVNQGSHRLEENMLVEPEHSDNSVLYKVLTEHDVVGHDHVDLFSEKEEPLLSLIKQWIDGGANQ